MQYRRLGRTNMQVSALGLGIMRLPGFDVDIDKGAYAHDMEEEAIRLAHHCLSTGVNILDTAYIYAGGNSEILAGRILRSWKGHRVYLSTKSPFFDIKKQGDFRRFLEQQLQRLDMDHIDLYYLHGLDDEIWTDVRSKCDIEKEIAQAKSEGLFSHLAFSSHDRNLKALMDTGLFDAILVQYNILDRKSVPNIEYAFGKDIGVTVMGPVAGGRLSYPSQVLGAYIGEDAAASTAQLALQFVLSNPMVSCALSGMSTRKMMDENAALASEDVLLNENLSRAIEAMAEKTKLLNDLYCTGCNYCRPCPLGINIPYVFQQMIYDRVYGLREAAEKGLRAIGKEKNAGEHPNVCASCGQCVGKCPQNIPIPQRLEDVCREYAHILQKNP